MNILCQNCIQRSESSKAIVIDSNFLTTNLAIPKLIKWEEVNFPNNWTIPSVVASQTRMGNKIDQIVQTYDEDVEVTFAHKRVSRVTRMTMVVYGIEGLDMHT